MERSVAWARVVAALRPLVLAAPLSACGFASPAPSLDTAGVDARPLPTDSQSQAEPASRAWLQPWTRRKPITLLESKIEAPDNGALTDFPVLVSITDPELAASTFASGADIIFTAGDGKTVLASELEAYTPATGQITAWVKVPSLSATADTTIYVYYGNQNPPARAPETVWTASYLGVWHLHQDPGPGNPGDIRDATSRSHHGTAASQMSSSDSIAARIGRGLRFDGGDEYLTFNTMDVSDTFTISMWIDFAGGNSVKTLAANSTLGRDTAGFRFFVNTANTSDRKLILETGSGTIGSGRTASTSAGAIAINAPTHVAAVVDRSTATALLYVNGISVASDTSISNNFRTDRALQVARMESSGLNFPGTLDEIRVSSTLRSPEWIRTSFQNQSQPSSFHELGAEQQAP